MKVTELKPVFVDTMPKVKEEGILYISLEFLGTSHLCPCGCGEEAYIPINPPHGWMMTREGDTVTLSPSLKHTFKCKSHYFIRENKIVWC